MFKHPVNSVMAKVACLLVGLVALACGDSGEAPGGGGNSASGGNSPAGGNTSAGGNSSGGEGGQGPGVCVLDSSALDNCTLQ